MSSRHFIARFLWLGLLAWSWAVTALAAGPAALTSFSAEYTLKRNGVPLGVATRSLKPMKDGQFMYASTTHATGMIAWFVKDRIDEHSIFTLLDDKIRPLEYVYNRHGGSKTRRVKLVFDWEKGVVTNVIDGDPWQMQVPPDVYDKLDYQLAIMRDLRHGRTKLQYNIADGGKLKTYAFDIMGEEQVETVFGKLKAVKIRRLDDKRYTTIWCAPSLSYLPVRLEQQETDGSQLSMHIQSVQGLPQGNAQVSNVNRP